jgi:ABC-type uncharacterized transport system involved in gliding motility auxiliary subunit
MKEKTKKSASKFQWRLNHYIATGLFILIFISVNYLSNQKYFRENYSGLDYTDLGSQSINVLKSLEQEVSIINFFSPGTDAASNLISYDVERILEEYEYHGDGKVRVRRIDPELDFEEAQLIAKEFKLNISENILIIQSGEQHRVVNYSELAQVEMPGMYNYGAPPRVRTFMAESAITETIISVTEEEQSKIYFLTGHGEYNPESRDQDRLGYSLIASRLERQNAEIKTLNLIKEGSIPSDCDLLVIAGPRSRLLPEELQMLKLYIEPEDAQARRLLVMLDPQTESGLEDLLEESYGLRFRDDVLLVNVDFLGQVRTITQTVVADFADHPSINWVRASGSAMQLDLGSARSIEFLPLKNDSQVDQRVELMTTPESYWGETGALDENISFSEEEDFPGPLVVGALVDEGRVSGGEVQLNGDRIALLGSANFLINETLKANQVDLMVNIVNWMLERENKLGISPKTPREYSLSLKGNEGTTLTIVNGLMALLAFTAILLTWMRRRK